VRLYCVRPPFALELLERLARVSSPESSFTSTCTIYPRP
jgi:hypothetical protein